MTDLRARLQAGLPERYTVEREIGRGGMACVYLARERHPQRAVAIKALRPEVSAALGAERFIREVDIVSKLTHPHIVPIFAAGDAAGILFYVMPYVEGETLRERILREGTIEPRAAVDIARDVAAALEHAHRREIIHRDIKPENILLHDESALVTDFGVARALNAAGDERVTNVNVAVGTTAFMSPEQARGEEGVDHRSDIFSLGCVLYEMLAGDPPAGRGAPDEILHRQATKPPASIRERAPAVPEPVAAVVDRALAWRREDRFQTAGELASALDALRILWTSSVAAPAVRARRAALPWLAAAAAIALAIATLIMRPAPRPVTVSDFALPPYLDSVVLIPVANRTGDARLDRLSEAITYEAITTLQTVGQLKVPSYLSVEARHEDMQPAALVDTFGVRLILAAALRPAADGIRLAADLVQGRQNVTLRHDSWPLGSAAADTVQVLAGRLVDLILAQTGLSRPPPMRRHAHSPAEDPFRLGQELLGRRTATALRLGIQAFHDALALDSTFAPAYAGLSRAYALTLFYRYQVGLDGYTAAGRSLAAANRAIALDARSPGAWQARGYLTSRAFGPDKDATSDFARALALAPNDPQAKSWSAYVLQRRGDSRQALQIAEEAIALDRYAPAPHMSLAYLGLQLGRYDLVLRGARIAAELEPDIVETRAMLARGLLLEGRAAECLDLDLGPHVVLRAACLHAVGRTDEAARLADSVADVVRSGHWADPMYTPVVAMDDLATYQALVGNLEQAGEWIARAFAISPLGIDRRVLESRLFERMRADPALGRRVRAITDSVWSRVLAASRQPSAP